MSSMLFSSGRIFISFSLTQSLTPSRRPSLPRLSEPSPLYLRISSSLPASLNLPSILNFSLPLSRFCFISLSLPLYHYFRRLWISPSNSSLPIVFLSLFLSLSIPRCHLPLSCISAFALRRLLSLSFFLISFYRYHSLSLY